MPKVLNNPVYHSREQIDNILSMSYLNSCIHIISLFQFEDICTRRNDADCKGKLNFLIKNTYPRSSSNIFILDLALLLLSYLD